MIILEFILIVFFAGIFVFPTKTKDITSDFSNVKISDTVVLQSAEKDLYRYSSSGKGRRRSYYVAK